MSKFYIEHKTSYLFVDCETTGLKPGPDEVLSISVIDQTGRLVFNSLIRPERRKKWVDAQNIHHISPEMVKDAPTYKDVIPQLQQIFRGAHVVIYNLDFDRKFLAEAMCTASSFHCCMKAYAYFKKEIDPYRGTYRWHKLEVAYDNLFHDTFKAHDSLADVQASLRVWNRIMRDYKVRTEFGHVSFIEGILIWLRKAAFVLLVLLIIIVFILIQIKQIV
jgi:DNA polymerase III epsilon subunit-like protein